jgi:hypothetical protein
MTGRYATALQEGDDIVVTLTSQNNAGKRVSITHRFDDSGNEIDNDGEMIKGGEGALGLLIEGVGIEEFPTAEYVALLEANKKKEADELTVAFQEKLFAAREQGGGSISDIIGNGLFTFLDGQGVTGRDGSRDGMVLNPEDVVVKAPYRDNGLAATWFVQLAPAWG